jgi:hypothetical protein
VHALPSSQLAGQLLDGSQVSPESTTLLPQVAEQSVSLALLHPVGQQPSPATQVVMALKLHATLQLLALPVIWSRVHALPSSHAAGQDVAGSQVSPESTAPLPQVAEQSESLPELHAAGQQPSPPVQAVMAVALHATLQVWALPVVWSSVQALPSSQTAGQDVAGSQVSPDSTIPLPQVTPEAPPVPELAPVPTTPPPPVPTPPVPGDAPPVLDSRDDSGELEHDAIVAAKPSSRTGIEAFFIGDSPVPEPAGSLRTIASTSSYARACGTDGAALCRRQSGSHAGRVHRLVPSSGRSQPRIASLVYPTTRGPEEGEKIVPPGLQYFRSNP